jgi:hypothetical protein
MKKFGLSDFISIGHGSLFPPENDLPRSFKCCANVQGEMRPVNSTRAHETSDRGPVTVRERDTDRGGRLEHELRTHKISDPEKACRRASGG